MIREVSEKEQKQFDKLANHPLQSWQWGEFRKKTGVEVSRLGVYEDKDLSKVFQITWHKIPQTPFCIGYCPKSLAPNQAELEEIFDIARKRKAIMIKWEPEVEETVESKTEFNKMTSKGLLTIGKPLFTKNTFWLNIEGDETALLAKMHQKTRYNIRLAEKKGVRIIEDGSEEAFEEYWKLTDETTKRQKFFAHTKKYHKLMWEMMIKKGNGHLLKAVFEGKTLVTWVLFELNGVLYYPYGASSSVNREVMASNLIMWEAIKYGRRLGCTKFDMWGSLGREPDTKDPWYGFHRFKEGYGGRLVEFVGTYDQVISRGLYRIYKISDKIRWTLLRIKAGLRI